MALKLSDTSAALSADDFSAAMAQFHIVKGARVAVAVSGGVDSMALALLISEWAADRGVRPFALTVDHQLRSDSAIEAVQVGEWLNAKGMSHAVLRWEEGVHAREVDASPQNVARDARYELMIEWCKANSCSHLFVAHHADDQVETFLMRLTRGSGVEGLAAMAPVREREGVCISRPLLEFSKAQLIEVCRIRKQRWAEDPSNKSDKSTRVRFRQAQALLEQEGFTRHRLLTTARHMRRAKEAIDHAVSELFRRGCAVDSLGVARLSVQALQESPEEIGLRTLSRLLTGISGSPYGPRFDRLENLYNRIVSEPWRDVTLHGCFVARDGPDLILSREVARVSDVQDIGVQETKVWDGRFRVTLGAKEENLSVGRFTASRLKSAAWKIVCDEMPHSALERVPSHIRETLPAIFDSKGLAAVPHAIYVREDLCKCLQSDVERVPFFPSSPPISDETAKMLHTK